MCTLEERREKLLAFWPVITQQGTGKPVEFLYECDNREMSTGEKRNKLLERAQGEYIVFVDDDDWVSNDYIDSILEAIDKSNPDVIGLHLLHTSDGKKECRTYHSLKYDHWYDQPDPERPGRKMYFRNPNHLNPVKREIALKVKFPHQYLGEDKVYSMGILPYLKTEEYIEQPIYHYLFKTGKQQKRK